MHSSWARWPAATGRGIDRLSGFFGVVAALLMLEIALVVTYEVVVRKLGRPTSWVFDISNWSQLALVFFALAYTQRERAHIQMNLFTRRLAVKVQVFLRLGAYILCAIVAFVYFWWGLVMIWDAYSMGMMTREMTRIPTWWIQWPIPLGGLILLLQFIGHIGNDVGWLLAGCQGTPEGLVPQEEIELRKVLGE